MILTVMILNEAKLTFHLKILKEINILQKKCEHTFYVYKKLKLGLFEIFQMGLRSLVAYVGRLVWWAVIGLVNHYTNKLNTQFFDRATNK